MLSLLWKKASNTHGVCLFAHIFLDSRSPCCVQFFSLLCRKNRRIDVSTKKYEYMYIFNFLSMDTHKFNFLSGPLSLACSRSWLFALSPSSPDPHCLKAVPITSKERYLSLYKLENRYLNPWHAYFVHFVWTHCCCSLCTRLIYMWYTIHYYVRHNAFVCGTHFVRAKNVEKTNQDGGRKRGRDRERQKERGRERKGERARMCERGRKRPRERDGTSAVPKKGEGEGLHERQIVAAPYARTLQ